MASRETLLAQTFVDVSDTLVADFDILDFLAVLAERCVEFLGVAEAGLMLADAQGVLSVAASSSQPSTVPAARLPSAIAPAMSVSRWLWLRA